MHKIIAWYNQNRRRVWVTILAVAVIAAISFALMNRLNENLQNPSGGTGTSPIDENSLNSITMSSQRSAISGKNITSTQEEVNVIDNFVSYCNAGKIEDAYNLLSDECKEEMYSNLGYFRDRYYKSIFGSGKKNVTMQNWTGNIFRVDFNEDALSTGRLSSENSFQDYITIVRNNKGENKLNINRYIGRAEINKTKVVENLQITVTKKDSYMDYEYYTFEVKNNGDKAALLGRTDNLKATFLTDSNGLIYKGRMNELGQQQLKIEAGQKKIVKINYFNEYSSTRKIESLTFSEIITEYEEDTTQFLDYYKMTIDL